MCGGRLTRAARLAAGVSPETGKAINLMTLIQLLRALEKLELLNYLNEEPEISPMMVMEAQKKLRKKASPTTRNSDPNEYKL
jgi:hypothetical protein